MSHPPSLTLIGAGIAGLCAAQLLSCFQVELSLIDKGTFPGGRLATRRSRHHADRFDHGAQYFTCAHPAFSLLCEDWLARGLIAPWHPRHVAFDDLDLPPRPLHDQPVRHVATPSMSALPEALARSLPLRSAHLVTRLRPSLVTSPALPEPLTAPDALLLALPAAQCAALLPPEFDALRPACEARPLLPCWAVMLTLDAPTRRAFDAAFINDARSPLSFVCCEASKPGRDRSAERWVLHASHAWSQEHLEETPEAIAALLTRALEQLLHSPLSPHLVVAHRWRYAIPSPTTPLPSHLPLIDPQHPVALAGDWTRGGRVEGAALSGLHAAALLIDRLELKHTPALTSDQRRWLDALERLDEAPQEPQKQ